jgi:hypothetical protein
MYLPLEEEDILVSGLMADLGFIPLVFWHPNTVLVIQRCGPVLGTQGGDLCPLLYSPVGILCNSYG